MLRRLLAYGRQGYGLEEDLDGFTDRREAGRIPTGRFARTAFLLVALRLGSVNALFQTRASSFWRTWLGADAPQDDRLRDVAGLMEPQEVREALRGFYRRRRRKKSLYPFLNGLSGLILDGHEFAASYKRHCPECLRREMPVRRGGEVVGSRIQYYHRLVLASLLFRDTLLPLDVEMLRPGEDEVAAGRRLLERLLRECPRAFDVVLADSLYLNPGFCKAILEAGKDFVIVLKNENWDLMKDARHLFSTTPPLHFTRRLTDYECWDIEGFTSWWSLGRPVRIVRSRETSPARPGEWGPELPEVHDWIWATTLPKARIPTQDLVDWGHARWGIENQGGFNELVNEWHADHVYTHDANAMVIFWLLTLWAFCLFHAFLALNLKPAFRLRHTARHFASLIAAEFYAWLLPGRGAFR